LAATVKEGLPLNKKKILNPNFRPRWAILSFLPSYILLTPQHSPPFLNISISPNIYLPSFTMGFTDFVSDAGLAIANSFFSTRSYIVG
jgi:hypothetical protein